MPKMVEIDFLENGIGSRGDNDQMPPPPMDLAEPVRIAGVLVYLPYGFKKIIKRAANAKV